MRVRKEKHTLTGQYGSVCRHRALRALAGPFADARFCPTGGIGEANAAQWLGEPNVVAVGGSWLCPAAEIRSGNWAGISAICDRTMKSLKPA